eukprot:gnl/TRDRNA2_/TRDRNA2_81561_c0_seq1.p1 gnl/TRDRNA2_/TRDRNA2_81561_c0~~gnl/TRDRNA2_/TRDRNA2_81561_c0_seq1.p1  ORF type:complete len:632 (+),score=121.38 gnl/TRDRNA2_/TRDRNA2_81561_c0_seq1:58-1953(+)
MSRTNGKASDVVAVCKALVDAQGLELEKRISHQLETSFDKWERNMLSHDAFVTIMEEHQKRMEHLIELIQAKLVIEKRDLLWTNHEGEHITKYPTLLEHHEPCMDDFRGQHLQKMPQPNSPQKDELQQASDAPVVMDAVRLDIDKRSIQKEAEPQDSIQPVETVTSPSKSPRIRKAKTGHHHALEITKEDLQEVGDPETWQQKALVLIDWWINLSEPERTGLLARIVGSRRFEAIVVKIIVCNAILMGVVANYDMANARLSKEGRIDFITKLESFFAIVFSVELLLKLVVHRQYFFVNDQAKWNWLDFCLVLFSFYDQVMNILLATSGGAKISFMRSLRVMKLAKLLRMARVLRVFKDLRLMIECIAGSLLSLFWCFVMLAFVLYVFALIFLQGFTLLMQESDQVSQSEADAIFTKYGSVEKTMLTLFNHVTGGAGWEESYDLLVLCGPLYSCAFIFYVGFFNFAVLNILTGMFVEHAMKCAEPDNDEMLLEQRRQELADRDSILDLCRTIDTDGSGTITQEEFDRHMQTNKGRHLLKLQGLDVSEAECFFRVLVAATDSAEVDLSTFVDCAMKMKGQAKAMDLQIMLYEAKMTEHRQAKALSQCLAELHSVKSLLEDLQALPLADGDGSM